MTVQTAQWRDNSVASPIWASPSLPIMAALIVLGCAGLGLAHKHGRMISHARPSMAAVESKATVTSPGAMTPVNYTHPRDLPATETQ